MSGYLSPKEAAAYLRVHYRTFLALARSEGIRPDGTVGRRKRYSSATLDRYIRTVRDREVRA